MDPFRPLYNIRTDKGCYILYLSFILNCFILFDYSNHYIKKRWLVIQNMTPFCAAVKMAVILIKTVKLIG